MDPTARDPVPLDPPLTRRDAWLALGVTVAVLAALLFGSSLFG